MMICCYILLRAPRAVSLELVVSREVVVSRDTLLLYDDADGTGDSETRTLRVRWRMSHSFAVSRRNAAARRAKSLCEELSVSADVKGSGDGVGPGDLALPVCRECAAV